MGSFETSALYDAVADTMVTIGTNGMLYLVELNTSYEYNTGALTIGPRSVTMTAKAKKQSTASVAVESSFAMYQQYVFYADMAGILHCVDTTSLTHAWAVDTGAPVESAVALNLTEDNTLWLYTANELPTKSSKGTATIARYNAMTGEADWQLKLEVAKPKAKGTSNDNKTWGVKASPVIGRNGLNDLVYYTVSGLTAAQSETLKLGSKATESAILAINKDTGKVVWACALPAYTESSPVAVYSEAGKGWILQCASDGTILMLDGLTGKQVNSLKVDGTISASPAVFGSTMVIATTGKNQSYIYGIALEDEETQTITEADEHQ